MQLNELKMKQRFQEPDDEQITNLVYIQFTIHQSRYAVPIDCVKEVVEGLPITPYPEKRSHHLGVIAIRGQILPVLAMGGHLPESPPESRRFLHLKKEGQPSFCLPVDKAKRMEIEPHTAEVGDIVKVDGCPVRLVDYQKLLLEALHE